jgi:hypothetical protein
LPSAVLDEDVELLRYVEIVNRAGPEPGEEAAGE